jgi:hypothetical protein
MEAAKLGVSEVQTITITAAQPPAPTINTTVTQVTNGTQGSSHLQEIVIDMPTAPDTLSFGSGHRNYRRLHQHKPDSTTHNQ